MADKKEESAGEVAAELQLLEEDDEFEEFAKEGKIIWAIYVIEGR